MNNKRTAERFNTLNKLIKELKNDVLLNAVIDRQNLISELVNCVYHLENEFLVEDASYIHQIGELEKEIDFLKADIDTLEYENAQLKTVYTYNKDNDF